MSHDWLTFVVVFLVKYLFVFVRDVLVLTNLVFAIYFVIVMLCYKHVLIKFMDFLFIFIHVGCPGQLARTSTNPHGP
jgi:hypothetical protein